MSTLFGPESRFDGLPADGFDLFELQNRELRRRAIIDRIHPALSDLGEDLLERLNPVATKKLHSCLPRLDWPRGYQPFCTWLALSQEAHGYQGGAQLNIGVHPDHVSVRLGWDCAADAFGRFEFLSLYGPMKQTLVDLARDVGLAFRVYTGSDWPVGSRLVFSSDSDIVGSFAEVARHGVWWELGRRHDLPAALDHVTSAALGTEAAELFLALLPTYQRIAGKTVSDSSSS